MGTTTPSRFVRMVCLSEFKSGALPAAPPLSRAIYGLHHTPLTTYHHHPASAMAERSTIPARRPRPIEVIDVDALPDAEPLERPSPAQRRRTDNYAPQASGSGSQARPETIVIYDSDEDGARRHHCELYFCDLICGRSHTSPAAAQPLRRQQRRPLTREHTYLDVTRPMHNEPPPVVIPNAQPFAFEGGYLSRARGGPAARRPTPARRDPQPPPAPAPRSHHQPAMGLGGALIALNRQTALENAERRRHHQEPLPQARRTTFRVREQPPPAPRASWSFMDSIRNIFGHFGRRHQEGLETWTSYMEDDNPWPAPLERDEHWVDELEAYGGVVAPDPPAQPKRPTYQPEWTHPGAPAPGFRYDFHDSEDADSTLSSPRHVVIDVDNDDAGASSSTSTSKPVLTLLCARCEEPLKLPGQDSSDEENKQRRIWVLRCGHIFDGKCIAELMKPPTQAADVESTKPEDPADSSVEVAKLLAAPVLDRKGKGKAVDRSAVVPEPTAVEDDGSIRSRLRPRRPAPTEVKTEGTELEFDSFMDDPDSSPRAIRPLPKRAKGKGRARRRTERYHWACPVDGCGMDHISVLSPGEDEWKMDPHKGAMTHYC